MNVLNGCERKNIEIFFFLITVSVIWEIINDKETILKWLKI